MFTEKEIHLLLQKIDVHVNLFFLKKKKAAMLQIIKEKISEDKNNKSHSMKVLKKNNSFHKKHNMNDFSTKLFFKPVNDIRLGGYKKAIE